MTYPQQQYGQTPQGYPQQVPQSAPPVPMPGALPFSQPQGNASGGFLDANPAKMGQPGNVCGHLVLITEVVEGGRSPANDKFRPNEPLVRVNMVDLDSPEQYHREGVTIKYPGIVNRLRVGATMVLGRVGVQTAANGPFALLEGFTDFDAPRAGQWLAEFQAGQHREPADSGSTFQGPTQGAQQQQAPAGPPPGYGQQVNAAAQHQQQQQGQWAQAPQAWQGYAPQGQQQQQAPAAAPVQQAAPPAAPPAQAGAPPVDYAQDPAVQAFMAQMGGTVVAQHPTS